MFFCFCFVVFFLSLVCYPAAPRDKRKEHSRSHAHKVIVQAFHNHTNGTITAKVAEMSPESFPRVRLEPCLQRLQVAK